MTVNIWKERAMADLNVLILHLPEKNKEVYDSLSQD
jgi:hypothetical protein